MATITASQSGTSTTITWSWTATTLCADWSVKIGTTEVDSGHSATSGSGSYNVGSYGSYTVSFGGRHIDNTTESASFSITLTQPDVTCRYDIYKTDDPPAYNYSYSQYTPGVTITVSHPSIAGYSYIGFETNASSYTSTTVVVPNSDFYILLFYDPIVTTVTCTIKRHIEGTTETIDTESVTAGSSLALSTYKPSVVDKGLYNFSYALINNTGTHYTTSITVPSSNFTLDYYFDPVSIVRIYATKTVNGSQITQWWPAQPYIYANSQWNPATPYIYANGHWNPQ